MIKRTLFFGNPAYLSTKNEQLFIQYPNDDKKSRTTPIEDVGYLVLEHQQITLTNGLIMKLVQNKTAIITCDTQHLPCSLLQPLVGHSEQTERFRHQLNASIPLKKNLWQQIISSKIKNQAQVLIQLKRPLGKLLDWSTQVKSGDADNHEAYSAAYYFQHIFNIERFSRNQSRSTDIAIPPNNLLNYGYAILRAVTARAIVSSGMLPSVGIFHRNKYNAYCLADDLMEAYRPYVDFLVNDMVENESDIQTLTQQLKSTLLKIPALDVSIDGKKSPLMNAMSRTTQSLFNCYTGDSRKLLLPEF